MATFFLIVLVIASGSFFGMKVARAYRGEPWVAAETFKNNLATMGPDGVHASTPVTRASRRTVRVVVKPRPRPVPKLTRTEGLLFVLALLLASCAFTIVCSLLGMLAWEFALGALAGTGLFAAFVLEPRPAVSRGEPRVVRLPEYTTPPEFEAEDTYATGASV
jgi:hypothetical protein